MYQSLNATNKINDDCPLSRMTEATAVLETATIWFLKHMFEKGYRNNNAEEYSAWPKQWICVVQKHKIIRIADFFYQKQKINLPSAPW